MRCVGLPVFLRYGETSMICVLNERAQARNLGGTAKAAFRPKAGREAAFLRSGGVNDSDETQRSGDSD